MVVSIDGLAPEHDARRAPATYDRILKHIAGHKVTVHCTVTRQQVQRDGYLEEFVAYWSANANTRQIWMSLYTPQVGEDSPECLRPEDRHTRHRGVAAAAREVPGVQDAQGADRVLTSSRRRLPRTASSRRRPSACRPTSRSPSPRASSAAPPTARAAAASRRRGFTPLAITACPAGSASGQSSTHRWQSARWSAASANRSPRRAPRRGGRRPLTDRRYRH